MPDSPATKSVSAEHFPAVSLEASSGGDVRSTLDCVGAPESLPQSVSQPNNSLSLPEKKSDEQGMQLIYQDLVRIAVYALLTDQPLARAVLSYSLQPIDGSRPDIVGMLEQAVERRRPKHYLDWVDRTLAGGCACIAATKYHPIKNSELDISNLEDEDRPSKDRELQLVGLSNPEHTFDPGPAKNRWQFMYATPLARPVATTTAKAKELPLAETAVQHALMGGKLKREKDMYGGVIAACLSAAPSHAAVPEKDPLRMNVTEACASSCHATQEPRKASDLSSTISAVTTAATTAASSHLSDDIARKKEMFIPGYGVVEYAGFITNDKGEACALLQDTTLYQLYNSTPRIRRDSSVICCGGVDGGMHIKYLAQDKVERSITLYTAQGAEPFVLGDWEYWQSCKKRLWQSSMLDCVAVSTYRDYPEYFELALGRHDEEMRDAVRSALTQTIWCEGCAYSYALPLHLDPAKTEWQSCAMTEAFTSGTTLGCDEAEAERLRRASEDVMTSGAGRCYYELPNHLHPDERVRGRG